MEEVKIDEIKIDFACLCRMRQDSIWGGQIEIQAFSLLTGVNVLIHQCSMIALEFLNWPFEFPCVQLAYQGTEHYSSVRVQDDTLAQLARNRKKSSFEQCKRAARFREKPEWQSLAKKLMTVAEIRYVVMATALTASIWAGRFRLGGTLTVYRKRSTNAMKSLYVTCLNISKLQKLRLWKPWRHSLPKIRKGAP
eukprot:Gregarina_sp_Poly_1__134@NODE_102_length_14381_cov_59_883820_g89_i0_p5_GENE_NODE_102_length_14381_cov_59_883820_g89_i0NODE_102_length_14381_cov_59_883820_g89_i0_p5_ORF_typecomplete_len194_score24_22OTU/PF02338_19/0_00033OTU/PF02338_19/2_1e03eIF3m_C_helix/PF18005_1/0_26_NODE_102_length_14381_cov_59_883820_g89_i01150912090